MVGSIGLFISYKQLQVGSDFTLEVYGFVQLLDLFY
jgi:hypothetical protein